MLSSAGVSHLDANQMFFADKKKATKRVWLEQSPRSEIDRRLVKLIKKIKKIKSVLQRHNRNVDIIMFIVPDKNIENYMLAKLFIIRVSRDT